MAVDAHCRVIESRESGYPDPLIVSQGCEVSVGERDAAWPAFRWCATAGGKQGWVPEDYLELRGASGVLRRAYSANELAVAVNDELQILDEVGGWYWCENAFGERGWVPALNVRLVRR